MLHHGRKHILSAVNSSQDTENAFKDWRCQMRSWICHFFFLFFFALKWFFRLSAGWDSIAILILAFYIYLTRILHVAGLHIQVGSDANSRLKSYFTMYKEEDFHQTTLSPSVNTSAGVCPIHPDNPVSICIALFELTPSLLFVLSLFAGRQRFISV